MSTVAFDEAPLQEQNEFIMNVLIQHRDRLMEFEERLNRLEVSL